jgi:hypothetical protein
VKLFDEALGNKSATTFEGHGKSTASRREERRAVDVADGAVDKAIATVHMTFQLAL